MENLQGIVCSTILCIESIYVIADCHIAELELSRMDLVVLRKVF